LKWWVYWHKGVQIQYKYFVMEYMVISNSRSTRVLCVCTHNFISNAWKATRTRLTIMELYLLYILMLGLQYWYLIYSYTDTRLTILFSRLGIFIILEGFSVVIIIVLHLLSTLAYLWHLTRGLTKISHFHILRSLISSAHKLKSLISISRWGSPMSPYNILGYRYDINIFYYSCLVTV